MRDSLKKSLADTPAQGFERYPKGSIVICNACARPIFKLDVGIALGEGSGSLARAFKPLSVADLANLAAREDIDGGVSASLRTMTTEQLKAHADKLHEVRPGDPMLCPACDACFVQVLSIEKHEVMDKAYTIELLTVPPEGAGKPAPISGKQIGYTRDWVH
jgi:hypothetical protein